MKINSKILFWFLVIAIIPSGITGFFSYQIARNILNKYVYNQLSTTAEGIHDRINSFIEMKKERIIDFSSDGIIRDHTERIGDYDKVGERLIDLRNHLTRNKAPLDLDILETFIMDVHGEIIASSNPQHVSFKRPGADFFTGAKRQGVYVTDMHQCIDADEPVIEVSKLLYSRINRESGFIGVIVNRIKGSSLANLLVNDMTGKEEGFAPGSNLRSYIINVKNQVIAGSNIHKEDILKLIINTKPVVRFNDTGNEIIDVYSDHIGRHVFGVSRYDMEMDWLIIVEEDVDKVFADMKYLWNFVIGMKIITVCIVIFLAIYISRGLTLPIKSLLEGTRKLGKGMLDYRISIMSRDEFGELAESFNTMAEYTEGKTRELEEALQSEKLTHKELGMATEKLLLKNRCQEAIGKISRLLYMDLDLQRIMDNAVNIFPELLGVKFCGIFLLDESKNNFHLKSGIGWSEDVIGRVAFAGLSSHADYTLIEGQPIVIGDMRTETRFSGVSFFSDLGIISGLCVPMVAGSHALGVIAVYTERARQFSKDEVNFLQSVGQLIAEVVVLKHGEEEIHKLSCAIKQSPSMVVITDTKGRIEYANPSFSRITGYASEEVVGKNPRLLKSGKTNPEEYKKLWEAITSGKEWRGEFYNRKKNGELTLESVSITPIRNTEGMITNFLKVSEDITERKKREEELRISQKMASLGQLTAGVCHEILNPLNIISSHVHLLLTETENGSNVEKDLKSILEEIDRIVNITDGMLRFSRKGELVTGKVEINSLLENVINIIEPEMKLSNIKFTKRFEGGLPEVMANSNELRQVFLNMITNARDAMPEGGALTVKTRSVRQPLPIRAGSRKTGELKGDFVKISFEDTGFGISKEDIGNVFDPFFTTKEEGKGTGLGLSESYGIIERHGGRMNIESEVGKGTTVIIDLPVKD
ncbi:MAG: PAS domain S-box protein [Candidatus Scalindua sp.]